MIALKRTLAELRARYRLEPELRDVYVEGALDAAVVRWHLESIGCPDYAIYNITTVEIPDELVVAAGQATGNRGSIVALACQLSEFRPDGALRVVCIADADTEGLRPTLPKVAYLALTDVASMEMYLCTSATLDKLIRLVLQRASPSGEDVLAGIDAALRVPFMVRVAGIDLGLPLRILPFGGCCSVSAGTVMLDVREYLSRVSMASGVAGTRDAIELRVSELLKAGPEDLRLAADGHDFLQMLFWYLRHVVRDRTIPTVDLLGRTLTGCIAPGLDKFPLFVQISNVVCA